MADLTFKNLSKLCDREKIPGKVPKKPGSTKGAFNGGDYLGAPGKDIFFYLPKLTPEQFDIIVEKHSEQYPRKPPGTHVGTAACIRYIYGQFEKQGVLRSKRDRKRMQNDRGKIDWSLPRKFISALQTKFREKEHYYGLTITYEMEGHRLGDEAVLYKDYVKLDAMEAVYVESVRYAHKCNSYKQMFTPYYWAAMYFILMKDRNKALHYCRTTIIQAERHCPDARASYVEKLIDCAQYLKSDNKKEWQRWRKDFARKVKNRAVKKMLQKI